jgi:cysteine-rich repeat protein
MKLVAGGPRFGIWSLVLVMLALAVPGCFSDTGGGDSSGDDDTGDSSTGDTDTGGPTDCGNGAIDPDEDCDLGPQNSDNGECTSTCQFPACGDGLLHIGNEDCDDGNDVDEDACTNACTHPACGDGIMQAGEECDDGENNGPGEACSDECQADICGNSNVGPNEECDNGDNNGPGQTCKEDCTNNVCGDGDVGPSEGCDDGNEANGDGCSSVCTLESCGNGELDDGEECDDGENGNQDDGCTDLCKFPSCGDGFDQQGEECDEGNANADTGTCTSSCEDADCGDGFIWMDNEECDDGNQTDDDGCTNVCTLPACGDGITQGQEGEECDDGNNNNNDGCSSSCTLEGCGDGMVQQGEDCDDGANGNQDDGCTDQCAFPICGDGYDQPNEGEDCDDGNSNNLDACPNDCRDAECNDGVLEGLEECDGNELDNKTCADFNFDGGTLACSGSCMFDTGECTDCGDGDVEGTEECDDGNNDNGDGCSAGCTIEQGNVNYVFLTSKTYTADMGGLQGADDLCNAAAADGNLPGTYVALLSTSNVDAKDRIAVASGWVRTDGLPFGNTSDDIFVTHEIFYPVATDEYGANVVGGAPWTGTLTDGTYYTDRTCEDWTKTSGDSVTMGRVNTAWSAWTSYVTSNCNSNGRLYCFGVDYDANVAPSLPINYRVGFHTDTTYTPQGSLDAMDDVCNTEAVAAGLDDNGNRTYWALLGIEGQSPIARFDQNGDNWFRRDGVALATSPADFAVGNRLAPLTYSANGTYMSGRPWTGGSKVDQQVDGETCLSWASAQNADKGRKGWAEETTQQFGWPAGTCDQKAGFYCLQK